MGKPYIPAPPAHGFGKATFCLLQAFRKWNLHKCPQLGAALAYYTVFSLAPLVLVLMAAFGMVFGSSDVARQKILEQLRYLADPSAVKVVEQIMASTAKLQSSGLAAAIGILVALFGASGVFGQLQDALNTIWEVKVKPGKGLWSLFRNRLLSFAMVAGVGFLLLVSLVAESVLHGFSGALKATVPGGDALVLAGFAVFDLAVIVLLFAMVFRFLPDAEVRWRDVWVGAALTALLFYAGKFVLGFYLGSGAAGSAYGAASSLITLLLWIFYSAQIVLFGAEFTQVYAHFPGSGRTPGESRENSGRKAVNVDVGSRERRP